MEVNLFLIDELIEINKDVFSWEMKQIMVAWEIRGCFFHQLLLA